MRPTVPLAAGFVLALASSSTASAYVVAKDENGNTEHWVVESVTFRAPDSYPAPLATADARSAITNAATSWTRASGLEVGVEGVSSGSPGYDPSSSDNHNDIFFLSSDWSYGDSLIAVTVATVDISTGQLLDTDIMFNAQDRQFSILPDGHPAGGLYDDVQSVATHEMGHALGLAHNPTLVTATMYGGAMRGEVNKRTLTADDIAGVQSIYAPLLAEERTPPAAGCATGVGAPTLGALFLS